MGHAALLDEKEDGSCRGIRRERWVMPRYKTSKKIGHVAVLDENEDGSCRGIRRERIWVMPRY